MAQGDVTIFDEFENDKGTGVHDLPSDVLKVALVDSTITPTAADATPRWADYSANEVSGTNYTAGGETIGSVTWITAAGKTTLAGDDVGWVMHASGPTDARWGIIVNTSAASEQAIGFVDLGEVLSLQADHIDIEWGVGGIHEVETNVAA